MPSCVFRYCKNYYSRANKTEGITYHIFPINEVVHKKWVSVVRRQRVEPNWQPSKCSTICSAHFRKKDKYVTKKNRILIKKDAVPFIKKQNKLKINVLNSSSSLYNVTESEMKAISAKNMALKKHIRKLNFERIQLRKRYKAHVQQRKRLKNKIISMVVKLREIKKKNYIYLIV